MFTNARNRTLAFITALALLSSVAPALALAPTALDTSVDEVTLSGKLVKTDEGLFALIETESGDAFSVRQATSSVDFESHVDAEVEVKGTWQEDADGNRYLSVTEISRAA